MYVAPRSLLFVPAHRDRFRERVLDIQVDAVILDLEDAVPPSEKDEARAKAASFIEMLPGRAFVRVNPVHASTKFTIACGEEDLAAVVRTGLRGIIFPKLESPEDLIEVDALIRAFERSASLPVSSLELLALVETAKGVQNLGATITAQIKRPFCLCFGAGDFTGDLGVEWTSDETECRHARGAIVIASRAGMLPQPIDTVFANIRDLEGLRANAIAAKTMGFQGKLAIHPDQVAIVEEVFTPQPRELEWAAKVLNGMQDAEERGLGAFTVDNKLIDYPILERAKAIINRGRAFNLLT